MHERGRNNGRPTRGKKIIETMSSNFSVNSMASPPSRGTIIPAKKAPGKWSQLRPVRLCVKGLTEDCVHTNNVRHERRAEKNENRNSHEEHGRPVLD